MPGGVEDPGVIDQVELAPDGAVELVMTEPRPWDGSDARVEQLQAKVASYVAFANEGRLVATYPEVRGRRVVLRLDSRHEPDESALEAMADLRRALQPMRFELRVG